MHASNDTFWSSASQSSPWMSVLFIHVRQKAESCLDSSLGEEHKTYYLHGHYFTDSPSFHTPGQGSPVTSDTGHMVHGSRSSWATSVRNQLELISLHQTPREASLQVHPQALTHQAGKSCRRQSAVGVKRLGFHGDIDGAFGKTARFCERVLFCACVRFNMRAAAIGSRGGWRY